VNPQGGPSANPLTVRELVVRYGATTAVDRLNLEVRPGEIYGLLGSNGAGKSSTLRSVVGLVRPASGELRVFGLDPVNNGIAAKAIVGYVPESPLVFDALTPREFLEFVSNVRRLDSALASERLQAYARALEVEGELEQPIATLSQGTRQKVVLTAALLHQPPLLVLDEPFNTLDPRAVRLMKELLPQYVARQGRGILFCTHTTEVAEQLCHRVGILEHGQLKAEGTIPELRRQVGNPSATLEEVFLSVTQGGETVRRALESLGGG
jgi:ABC-2 type transport system ATP-binding protein